MSKDKELKNEGRPMHVLVACVLRYYFEVADSGSVVFEEDGYTVEEARSVGLNPILACRVSVAGMPYSATRVGRLDDGVPIGPLLQGVWSKEGAEFKGPPTEILVDAWLMEAVPQLVDALETVGCVARTDISRKHVSGSKGALQRHRWFFDRGRLTIERINEVEKEDERMRWATDNQRADCWRYLTSGTTRHWPEGVQFLQCVLKETPNLWGGLRVNRRPERDPEGDVLLNKAFSLLISGAKFEDKKWLKVLQEGTTLMVAVLKPALDGWLEGFAWRKKAYLFAGEEGGLGLVRLRLGVPTDRLSRAFGRDEQLPSAWPHMNEWVSEIDGFGLEIQLWKMRKTVELVVAIVVEGVGECWIKDALRSEHAREIGRLIKRGGFKVHWRDRGGEQLKDQWQELVSVLSGKDTFYALCLERAFQHNLRADEIRSSMDAASKLADTMMRGAVQTWRHDKAESDEGT